MKYFIFLILLAATAKGLMLQVPDSTLVGETKNIIRGKVINKRIEWVNNGKMIYTFIDIEVKKGYKGSMKEGAVVTIAVPGGYDPVKDRGFKVSDQPEYKMAEDAVLYLEDAVGEKDGINYDIIYDKIKTNCYRTNFLYQGKHSISYDHSLKTEVVHKTNDGMNVSLEKYKANLKKMSLKSNDGE